MYNTFGGNGGITLSSLVGNVGCLTQLRWLLCHTQLRWLLCLTQLRWLLCLTQLSHKSSATHSYWCVQCVQTVVWLPAFGIFHLCTDADGCDCTQGMCEHPNSLHWKLTVWKIPCCTRDLNPHQYCALAFSVGHSTNWAIPAPRALNMTLNKLTSIFKESGTCMVKILYKQDG